MNEGVTYKLIMDPGIGWAEISRELYVLEKNMGRIAESLSGGRKNGKLIHLNEMDVAHKYYTCIVVSDLG